MKRAKGPAGASKGQVEIAEAPPKLLEARQHGNTVLECSANGSPAPEITWYKDGLPYIKDFAAGSQDHEFGAQSMGETKSRINLDCVSESDAGLYECVATSNGASTSVGTQVHVSSFEQGNGCVQRRLLDYESTPPKIYQWIGTYLQPIGQDARLICRAEGQRSIYWIGPTDQEIDADNGKYKVMPNGDLLVLGLRPDLTSVMVESGTQMCGVDGEAEQGPAQAKPEEPTAEAKAQDDAEKAKAAAKPVMLPLE